MPRFYTTNTDLAVNQEIILEDNIVSHIHVLRLRADEPITLFNGDGYDYLAIITALSRNLIRAYIKDKKKNYSSTTINALKINLAMCLIANDRMDIVVQKATELGVSQITPVISEFSQRINPERLKNKLLHWQKIIISACEQSGRSTLPEIYLPINFAELVSDNYTIAKDSYRHPFDGKLTDKDSNTSMQPHDKTQCIKIICNQHSDDSATIKLSNTANNLLVLVGPEGGFSQEESMRAKRCGFISLQLGMHILRAETAAIASISYLRTMLNKW